MTAHTALMEAQAAMMGAARAVEEAHQSRRKYLLLDAKAARQEVKKARKRHDDEDTPESLKALAVAIADLAEATLAISEHEINANQ